MEGSREFGNELRRRRQAAHFSLSAFAAEIYYSKGYLSRVENGDQRPSADLARRCDRALSAGGELIRLQLSATGGPDRQPAPTLMLPVTAEPFAVRRDYAAAAQAVDVQILFDEGFEHTRRLGHRLSPRIVLSGLLRDIETLSSIAAETRDQEAVPALRGLVARQQEYAGWMFQEHGDPVAALRWTIAAGQTAAAAGDSTFELWTRVRQAEIALYAEDADAVLGLCSQVAASCRDDDGLGAVVYRVAAQGHALNGDRSACFRALQQSAELSAGAPAAATTFGTTSLADPVAMVTGWVLFELGDVRRAADTLDREVCQISATSVRSRARFGVRAALAHAMVADLDEACAMTRALLGSVEQTASATIAGDLRQLGRTLSRWSTDRRVSDLLPDLRAASRLAAAPVRS
jgi:transcriptional regulator with XRE-family HTH domain